MEHYLNQVLLLLALAVGAVLLLQRLRLPSLLAYLLVGVLLGPHTPGPILDSARLRPLAEFGVVFLLFTIGLAFSLPSLRALRPVVLALGAAQVALTTAIVGVLAWLFGLPPAAAFVVGTVFAQSSTAVIERQLAELRQEQSRHGRLALAMSVFQDVAAVPFVVVIPVLGATAAAGAVGATLAVALLKALAATMVVVAAGRWLVRPLFQLVAQRRSAEIFTLAVLLVSLAAASVTHALGLSLAFGAFLAGMMLGETEFRHQVESAIRPFRDVLLGLFFVGIGTLVDPTVIVRHPHVVLGATAALLASKAVLVAAIVRLARYDVRTAWRTGLVLAVGGEFGFALIALALGANVIGATVGQVAIASVFLSMAIAPFLIRHDAAIAARIAPAANRDDDVASLLPPSDAALLSGHVIVCGYGRIGQAIGHMLEEEGVRYVALDLDSAHVRQARLAGERVFYADGTDRNVLETVGLASARLLVISHDDTAAALATLAHVRSLRPEVPVMVRTRDEAHVDVLRAAGATEIVPETLEASLMIATHAMLLLELPVERVVAHMRSASSSRYRLFREVFRGEDPVSRARADDGADRLKPIVIPAEGVFVGRPLYTLDQPGILVTALVRRGRRQLAPPPDTLLEAGDTVVVFGPSQEVEAAEHLLLA